MLILQRGLNQTFTIGDDITIKVIGFCRGNSAGYDMVKIGIDAPREKQILRDDMKKRRPPKNR